MEDKKIPAKAGNSREIGVSILVLVDVGLKSDKSDKKMTKKAV